MFSLLINMASVASAVIAVVVIAANEPPSPDVVEPGNVWSCMEQKENIERCFDLGKKPSAPDDNSVPTNNNRTKGKRVRVADAEKYVMFLASRNSI